MKRLSRLRPSPAMVVACIALTVALGGTSIAAIEALPRNSVGAKQLKRNAVTGPKIKANAVNGAKVANNSLTGADVNEASLGTVPSATNATNAVNAANATNATISTNALQLGGKSPADFVRWAAVSNNGGTPSIARGFGSVSAARFGGTGQISVQFDRDIRGCAWLATRGDVTTDNPWTTMGGGSVSTAMTALSPSTLRTETYNAAGTHTDDDVFVAILC